LIYRCGGSQGLSLFRRDPAPPLTAILAVALVARMLLLPLPPSDDVYRYAWEGLVQVAGFNPYAVAPSAAALEHLRPDWWVQINHPDHAAIYPPLALRLFAMLASVSPQPFAFKAAMLLAECVAIGLLLVWLRRANLPLQRVAAYSLCPLALTAVGREGHMDALMLLGLALMLAATAGSKRVALRAALLAGAGLGLAIGAKWVAIVLAPWLGLRILRPTRAAQGRRLLAAVAVAAVIVLAPAMFDLQHGWETLIGPLRHFSTKFHNLDYVRQWLLDIASPDRVNVVSLAALAVVSAAAAFMRVGGASAIAWTLGAVIVLAPTVHPWYLLGVIPALCARASMPLLILCVTMVLAYEGDHQLELTGNWSQPAWVAGAVWAPFLISLLLVSMWRGATLLARRAPRVE
jgi:hypothetical protein